MKDSELLTNIVKQKKELIKKMKYKGGLRGTLRYMDMLFMILNYENFVKNQLK